jgi:hypothetical protein
VGTNLFELSLFGILPSPAVSISKRSQRLGGDTAMPSNDGAGRGRNPDYGFSRVRFAVRATSLDWS